MLTPALQKNDKKASLLIWIVSIFIAVAVAFLNKVKFLTGLDLGFDVHLLARTNAVINGTVSILLVWALIAVKNKNFLLHKKLMMGSILLSCLFLVSYIGHHLLASETRY